MSGSTTRVITPKAILSYPHLHQPQAPSQPGGKAKYSASLVWTKEELATEDGKTRFAAMQQAVLAAAIDKFGTSIKLPNGQAITIADAFKHNVLKSPFRSDSVAKGYPAESVFTNARTESQPGVVYARAGIDGKPEPMAKEQVKEETYPGVIVRASLTAFGYENSGNRGVSFALNNLQKIADSTRLDGRVAAESEFDADLSAAPADLASLGIA